MLEIEKDRCQKKSRKCLPVRNASSCTEWAVPGLNRGPIDFQSLELNSQHPDNTTLAPPPAVGRSAGRSDDESEGGNDDPDLSRLLAAWPTLPEPIRRAMLAILEAAT